MKNLLETYQPTPIITKNRVGFWSMVNLYIATLVCLPAIMMGSLLAQHMPFSQAITAIFIGQLVVTSLYSMAAYIGASRGIPAQQLMRQTFGPWGSRIVAILTALSLVGWFGVQAQTFANATQTMLANQLNIHTSTTLIIFISAALMGSIAAIGFKGLSTLSNIAVPLMLALMVAPVAWGFWQHGLSAFPMPTITEPWPVGMAAGMLIGGISIGLVTAADWYRFAQTPWQAYAATWVSSGILTCLFFTLVIALVYLTGQTEFSAIMQAAGMLGTALLLALLATWTTNDVNIYLAAVNFAGSCPRISQATWAALSTALGAIAAILGIAEHFVGWLILLSVLFAPAGIIMAYQQFFIPKPTKNHQLQAIIA